MKIRKGFVSNSSSSSFVVAFPKGFDPSDTAVKELLFGDSQRVCYYEYAVDADQAASIIASDMRGQAPNNNEAMIDALSGHLPGAPDYDDFRIRDDSKPEWQWNCDWESYEKALNVFREKMMENMKAEFGDADIYCFEYSDNDGHIYCTLEHGDTFAAVPHLRVSKH